MPISAGQLRQLHHIHRQLTDLWERLERGPKQVRASERNTQHLEQELAKAKEARTKARISADEKQLQLRTREDRIADLKLKRNACASNKEYQALNERIAADEQANSVLTDEILETLEKIDALETAAQQLEAKLNNAKQELEKTRERVRREQARLETDLARVTRQLEQAEAALPPDFKAEYDRIVQARGEDALAQVDGETCSGCYRVLSPQTMNELYLAQPVFCRNCGRLLYLPEDRAAGSP